MARESLDIPHSMQKVYRRFERWRSAHTGRLPDSERLVGRRGGIGSAARSFPHGESFAFGVWQVEAVGGIGGSGGAQ